MKNKESSKEKLHKIDLQTFNHKQPEKKASESTTLYKGLVPSVNYFGAGSSDEDRSFKDFFNKY